MEAEKGRNAAGTRKDYIVCFIYYSSCNDDDFPLAEKQKGWKRKITSGLH